MTVSGILLPYFSTMTNGKVSTHGCSIVVLNKQEMSPEQEMVQDLMTIIHCFSSRLYGLRNYKRSIKKALSDESIQD